MLQVGDRVIAEVELLENPWAESGEVVGILPIAFDTAQMAKVKWPSNSEPVLEFGWTLRKIDPHNISFARNADDPSPIDQRRIDAAEWERM